MIEGIVLAVGAGLMLGLYALPEKFTKDFKFENTWGLFFMLTMFLVPILASFTLIKDFNSVFAAVPSDILFKMAGASVLWGIGGQPFIRECYRKHNTSKETKIKVEYWLNLKFFRIIKCFT